jgi:hypothetical protein
MPAHRFSTRLKGYDLNGTTTFVFVPETVMAAFAPSADWIDVTSPHI